ncbi:hypothetical protein H6775_02250 [Candidatus Nomurabacteria bacterium]|nr:hypothetical protein [Candidatus Nomurabacteria bacterium]
MINARDLTDLAYTGFLFEFSKEYGSIFYQVSDLENIGKEIWNRLDKDKDYFKKAREIHRVEQKKVEKIYQEIEEADIPNISDQKLYEIIEKSIQAIQDGVGTGHIIEGFALTVDEDLKAELLKYTKDSKVNNKVYADLTTPEEKSFFRQADEDLSEIANSDMDKNLIEKFIDKYYWIRTNYGHKEIVDEAYATEEAKTKKDISGWSEEEIKNTKKDLVDKFNIPDDLVWKTSLVAFVGAWQDERKKYIMMGAYYVFLLTEELSKRTGIEMQYLKYLLPSEVKNAKELLPKLKERREYSWYAFDYEDYYVISGEDTKVIQDIVKSYEEEVTDVINGTVASSGIAKGVAKICTNAESLDKVEEGDILVASMTRPEYISAMKKAAAFITDEGGITCHAAIVSREMKKPCIIGTKFATKVLKDGDLVEVDGEHGVVNIIKHNE